ncbi:HAD family hydrolase [Marinilactibacillus psychrotolerans]|uniref:HAD family hydrolase n=1 Tax=Marinilactibacillus psychrotolerans TaxID=191770 RepID=A0A5R9BZH2_9LACT|nr:HAD-IA family hydrolase [Marinilactibacillus psychrotolerans]TLQ05561.1 HAD family hydrolase [Marinilactibacillus psychrotolerans]
MVKAVIFDLDDTLISEKEYIKSGYRHVAGIIEDRFAMDKKQVFNELMSLFKVSPLNVFNRLYDKYQIEYSKEMILDLVKEYRGHLPDIQFYNDVIPCLSELKKSGVKVGIITDGYAIAQRQKLKAIQADEYFDEIIVTDELGREYWKPHPKAFELMKEKFRVNFEEMIYVGDNPEKDFYISKIYPIKTVRIIRGGVHREKSYLEGIKASTTVNNLKNFINIWR